MAIGEVEKTIDVDLPVRTVYNQWTMFEEFPRFMEGIERVEQLTPERLRWYARIGGRPREWEARIVEQIPDRRIVWKAEHGDPNSGAVAFSEVDGGTGSACTSSTTPMASPRTPAMRWGWCRGAWKATCGGSRSISRTSDTKPVDGGVAHDRRPMIAALPGRWRRRQSGHSTHLPPARSPADCSSPRRSWPWASLPSG